MNQEKESVLLILALFLLLPYLMTILLLGREACPVSREVPMEEYVAAVAASEISWDYSKEALKAQAVIARSSLYVKQKDGKEAELLDQAAKYLKSRDMNYAMYEKYQVFQEAARETQGQILQFQGQAKEVPYHALSQGKTRAGAEVLGEDYAYLPSVETPKDIDSPLYVEGCYFSVEELENKLKETYSSFSFEEEAVFEIQSTDSAGYVMEIQIGNQDFQGEQIRELLGLPSSCFTIQRLEQEVRFLCKGIGHGMGMSQYTANEMALEGKSYEEILNYFFPEMELGATAPDSAQK